MKTACPTEDRLKQLIQEAFSESVLPDPVRLQQIESRLANKLSRAKKVTKPGRSHWLIWLLLAVSATATAWWASQYLAEPVTPENQSASPQPLMPRAAPANSQAQPSDNNAHSNESTPPSFDHSPVIDRRERY